MFFDLEVEEAVKACMLQSDSRNIKSRQAGEKIDHKPADAQTQRLNNLIAEFMACGASEDEAKTVAREIVDKGRIAPCEAQYRQAPIAYAYEDCKEPEDTRQSPYDEAALVRYFVREGWPRQGAIELARGMIERGSYLPPHEQMKYLACERREKTP